MRTMPLQPIRPPRLRAGSRVALIAPAGPIDERRLASAIEMCSRFGLEAVPGTHAMERDGYLAGDDTQRAADLQRAIGNPHIDAIWALRGGYGTMRILRSVDFRPLLEAPKAYIGFSDNTSIHLALAKLGIVSFHAPHAGAELPAFAESSFRAVLFEPSDHLVLQVPPESSLIAWNGGVAEGRLIGGNLALLAAAEGTAFALPSDGAILFIEDVGEPPYRIDRLMTQLELSGALDNVAAVLIGQLTDCDDETASSLDVMRAKLMRLGVPLIANAPIGHVPDNWTLPMGVRTRVDADRRTVTIMERAVI